MIQALVFTIFILCGNYYSQGIYFIYCPQMTSIKPSPKLEQIHSHDL